MLQARQPGMYARHRERVRFEGTAAAAKNPYLIGGRRDAEGTLLLLGIASEVLLWQCCLVGLRPPFRLLNLFGKTDRFS